MGKNQLEQCQLKSTKTFVGLFHATRVFAGFFSSLVFLCAHCVLRGEKIDF
jgi:hypothetical protein